MQQPDLSLDRNNSWVVGCGTRFQLLLKQCCKTSGRFFCPFHFNITRSKNMLEMEIKSNIVCSRESALTFVVNVFNENRNTTTEKKLQELLPLACSVPGAQVVERFEIVRGENDGRIGRERGNYCKHSCSLSARLYDLRCRIYRVK